MSVSECEGTPVVVWRIEGVLNLPWAPPIKPYFGASVFRLNDENGLIESVREYWSISALDAFASAILPWCVSRACKHAM